MEQISGTATSSFVLSEHTLAGATLFGSRVPGPVRLTYAVVDAFVEHVLPNLHRLKVRARRSSFSGTPAVLDVSAEYSLPLAVPLDRITSVGTVSGTIVDTAGRGVGGAPRSGFIQVGGGYGNLAGVSLRSSILRDTLTSTPIERRENVV